MIWFSSLFWRSWAKALRDLSGFGDETVFIARWLFLRLFAVAYFFAFAQYCVEGPALVGPNGVEPVGQMLRLALRQHSWFAAHFWYPSVFWLGSSDTMIMVAAWGGAVAAVALFLGLWPRLSLAACWFFYVSFVSPTRDLSPTIVDALFLETTLMAIPLAPSGLRPGLGLGSPPSAWAIFFIRFQIARLLFQAGMGKFLAYDGQWRTLEYMNLMHQYTPFPTYFAYLDHSLPRAWHALESAYTILAELGGSILIFFGRRARFLGVCLFIGLQMGIIATSNFGSLNFIAISLCLLMFDDSVYARLKPLGQWLARAARPAITRDTRWKVAVWSVFWTTNAVLGTAIAALIVMENGARTGESKASLAILGIPFKPVGRYTPFAFQYTGRYLFALAGTFDDGHTWQEYGYRYVQQDESQMCPWIAPYFARFDAAVQKYGMNGQSRPIFREVAAHLLQGDVATQSLFRGVPNGGKAPQAIRFLTYQLTLNDWATYRATGHFWQRRYLRDFEPWLVRDQRLKQIWGTQ